MSKRGEAAIHGHAVGGKVSRTYVSWAQMIARCTSNTSNRYQYYGARGIKVCDQWRTFAGFLSDMGERPAGKSLDRIQLDGNYEPSNCRWADAFTQAQNKSNTTYLEFNGERKPLSVWARDIGVTPTLLSARISRLRWPVERALTTPRNTTIVGRPRKASG